MADETRNRERLEQRIEQKRKGRKEARRMKKLERQQARAAFFCEGFPLELPTRFDFERPYGFLDLKQYQCYPAEYGTTLGLSFKARGPPPPIPDPEDDTPMQKEAEYDSEDGTSEDEDDEENKDEARVQSTKKSGPKVSQRQPRPPRAPRPPRSPRYQSKELLLPPGRVLRPKNLLWWQEFPIRTPTPTLTSMPSEIRQEIYRALLVAKAPIEVYGKWTKVYPRRKPALCINILLTCRGFHDEAIRVLYGENTFLYRLRDPQALSAHLFGLALRENVDELDESSDSTDHLDYDSEYSVQEEGWGEEEEQAISVASNYEDTISHDYNDDEDDGDEDNDGEDNDSEYNDSEYNDGEYTGGEYNDGEDNDGEDNDDEDDGDEDNDGEYNDSEDNDSEDNNGDDDDGGDPDYEDPPTRRRRRRQHHASSAGPDIYINTFRPLIRKIIVEAENNRQDRALKDNVAEAIQVFSRRDAIKVPDASSKPRPWHKHMKGSPDIHELTVRVAPLPMGSRGIRSVASERRWTFLDWFDFSSAVLESAIRTQSRELRIELAWRSPRFLNMASPDENFGSRLTGDMRPYRAMCRCQEDDGWDEDRAIRVGLRGRALRCLNSLKGLHDVVLECCQRRGSIRGSHNGDGVNIGSEKRAARAFWACVDWTCGDESLRLDAKHH